MSVNPIIMIVFVILHVNSIIIIIFGTACGILPVK